MEATTKKQPRKGTGESDFALLRVTKAEKGQLPERFPSLPLEMGPAVLSDGDRVTVAGYPAEGLTFREVQNKLVVLTENLTITSIQSFERPNKDLLILSPSAASASGISGGPIVGSSGGLIAIAFAVKEGTVSRDDRSLRAITLLYIDRALRVHTGRSLLDYISDMNLGGVDPALSPFSNLWRTVEKTLRNTR